MLIVLLLASEVSFETNFVYSTSGLKSKSIFIRLYLC